MIGTAPRFLAALDQLARFAVVDVPVLISGETGTGKELAARVVHYLSRRADRPFVPVNCGAMPGHLFENELFGHGRGAFTDAREAVRGLVAHAEGGTLMLDEVDSLDHHAQAALLRFLQDGRYRPLGAGGEQLADVRVIAASNAPLDRLVAEGRMRADLLFRLDVARVELPALRERREDLVPLARHFVAAAAARYGRCPPRLGSIPQVWLEAQPWPGNIRELENAMHRAVLLSDGAELTLPTAPPAADRDDGGRGYAGSLRCERARSLEAFERNYLEWLLGQTHGNISSAARLAETERRHLGRMIRRQGIDPAQFRAEPGRAG